MRVKPDLLQTYKMDFRKSLENLIIATLLTKCEIIKTPTGLSIDFELRKRKVHLFKNYILQNNLSDQISFDKTTLKGTIKPSIIVEKLLRDWTRDKKIIAINPVKLNVNTYLLWICLYGRKTLKHVVIDTELPEFLHSTLLELFNSQFNCDIYSNGDFFYIKPFHLILLRAIETKKTVLEIAELNYLVPYHEIEEMLFKLSDQDEEGLLLNAKQK